MYQRETTKRLLRTLLATCIAAQASLLSQQTPAHAGKPTASTSKIVSSVFSIRSRMEKDHRIHVRQEDYKDTPAVHVYLMMSEQQLPYVVSLGWMKVTSEPPVGRKKKRRKGLPRAISMFRKGSDFKNPLVDNKKGLAVIDENGFIVPAPGDRPCQQTFEKSDLKSLYGFDDVLAGKLKSAQKEYQAACKLAPRCAKHRNNLGAMLAVRGRYSEATEQIDRAIKMMPNYAVAYANRALLSLAIGQPDLAIKDASRALELQRDLLAAAIAYGRALIETGKKEEALAVAEKLRRTNTSDWQTMLLLADAQLAVKDYKSARVTLKRLSVLNPTSSDLHMKLARAQEKSGDLDAAIKQARNATRAAPNDARAHIVLGKYLEDNQDLNAACLQFERALELSPDKQLRKTAMGSLLRVMIKRQQLPTADSLSKEWVAKYPKDPSVHYNRAWIASQIDGIEYRDEAINEYRKTLELDPDLKSAHYNLGLLLLKAQKPVDALKELTSFVKKAPDDVDAKHAQELIDELSK